MTYDRPRIAVIGHVEHVTIARVPSLPEPGEIVHLDEVWTMAAGGGGIAFFQLTRGPADLHLFTALGNDGAASFVEQQIEGSGATAHVARRDAAHTRDLVLLTPDGERTIFVVGEPLQPAIDDALPWDLLASFDAVYFTARDPAVLREARRARLLVVTARRREALAQAGITADVVVGSASDPREVSVRGDYPVAPRALVMTEGAQGGRIEKATGASRFTSELCPEQTGGYGAGDSFAGALTWYLVCGLEIEAACRRAAVHGAAVLRGPNPIAQQLELRPPA